MDQRAIHAISMASYFRHNGVLLVLLIIMNSYESTTIYLASSKIAAGGTPGKINRGAPLEVQNGTQQELNEMMDLVNFGG